MHFLSNCLLKKPITGQPVYIEQDHCYALDFTPVWPTFPFHFCELTNKFASVCERMVTRVYVRLGNSESDCFPFFFIVTNVGTLKRPQMQRCSSSSKGSPTCSFNLQSKTKVERATHFQYLTGNWAQNRETQKQSGY